MTAYENTYWNGKGKYPRFVELLHNILREDPNPKDDCLARFNRVAMCYYDLYNNGLCNRATEFKKLFGFAGGVRARASQDLKQFYDKVDARMDVFILAAIREQYPTLLMLGNPETIHEGMPVLRQRAEAPKKEGVAV